MSDEIHVISGDLRIEENFIADDEILLQISSISDISITELPGKKFQAWTVIFLIVGGILFLGGYFNENYYIIGMMLVFGEFVYTGINILDNSVRKMCLCISMNSGRNYIMFCTSEQFLKDVIAVIECCINNHNIQAVQIDFNNCQIFNSPITMGEGNEVSNDIRW